MLARSAEACSARQRAESDGPKSLTGITSGLNMHQARHLFAMELRRVAGIEASSQALLHSDLSTTLNIYGHQDGVRSGGGDGQISRVASSAPGRVMSAKTFPQESKRKVSISGGLMETAGIEPAKVSPGND